MSEEINSDSVVVILTTTDSDLSWTWSFLLSAVQIPHQIVIEGTNFLLLVPTELKTQALQEISAYFSENSDWPHKHKILIRSTNTLQPPTVFLVGILILFYSVTGPWSVYSIWFQQGAGDSKAILEQFAWHRLVTSLTLHADIVHLLDNCILGGILLHFLFLNVGTGLGLFSLLAAAVAGNYINVLLHGPGHIFFGFSTAIFSAVGILSMISYEEKNCRLDPHVLVPIMAGAALLAMLGSTGERTDLGAHFFGLLCGFFTGKVLCLVSLRKLKDSIFFQILLFIIAIFFVTISWIRALQI
jgi:rhomboid protease GluP